MSKASSVVLDISELTVSKVPELQLWAAVLHLAILDAHPYIIKGVETTYEQRRHGGIALNWLMSNHCRRGSFVWVCDLLGVDKGQIRGKIGMKEDKVW